jgi:Phage capsid protein
MPNLGPNDALVLQFETEYDHLFQQMLARLGDGVRTKDGQMGTMSAFGLLGESDVQDITGTRHGETNFHDSPSYRRWAVKGDYQDAQILDEEDALEVLVDLEMGYGQNSVMAMNRKIDKVIIDAVTATAVSGATGTATTAFNTAAPATDGTGGNQIVSGGTGLVIDKMRLARAVFDAREVGVDEMSMGNSQFVWVTDAAGHQDLLEQTEVVSTDYIGINIVGGQEVQTRMPLVGGRIPYYMGFRIKISNQLNLSGTAHVNLAWHFKAMGFARWAGRRIWVGDLPTRNLARGVIVKEHFGSVRVHDRGVLAILCEP